MDTSYIILNVIIVMIMSSSLTGLMIGKILRVVRDNRLYDSPGGRHIHEPSVSRLGGLAFVPAIVLSISFILCVNLLKSDREAVAVFTDFVSVRVFILSFGTVAVTCLYLLGLFDDLFGVRYEVKLAVQFFAACLLAAGGLTVSNLHGFAGIYGLPALFALPLTVFVILFIINAINFIDGVDGLASSVTALCMSIPGVMAVISGDYMTALLIFAVIGTLIPFFCHNVWGRASRGSKIFMGDTGSLTLGVCLSILVIHLLNTHRTVMSFDMLAVMSGALAVPCFDLLSVVIYRVCRRRNPFIADRSHIHYRLLALGLSHAQTTGLIIAWSVSFILLDMLISNLGGDLTLIAAANAAYWSIANGIIVARIRRLRSSDTPCPNLCD